MTNEFVSPQVGVCSHCQKVKEIRKVQFYFPLIELRIPDASDESEKYQALVQEVNICHDCTARMMHFIEIPVSDDILRRLVLLDTKTHDLYSMNSPRALRKVEIDNPWKEGEKINFFDNRFITMAMHFGVPDVAGAATRNVQRNTYGRIFSPSEFSYFDSSSKVGEKRYIIFTVPENVASFIQYNTDALNLYEDPKIQLQEEIYELLLDTLKNKVAEFHKV